MLEDLHCYNCGKKLKWSQAHIYYEDGWRLAYCSACRLTPVAPDRAEARDGDGESPTRAAGEHDG